MISIDSATADSGKSRLVAILGNIPWASWEEIVRREPEWRNMESFLTVLGFGPFAVLMVATGLNDYQTRGTADQGYWPPIRRLLETLPTPSSPDDMYRQLLPFYQNERLRQVKVNRLGTFLRSPLARRLWEGSPQLTSKEFSDIWVSLADTMMQKPEAKTISFAMKCLGLALLMTETYDFEFSRIPIPVDSRVGDFTLRAGLSITTSDQGIREVWSEILSLLRKNDNRVTMIHLDSLVWQVEPLSGSELREYFPTLDIEEVGDDLVALLSSGAV